MSTRIGVVGFRGYSGTELVSILRRHPRTEPVLLEHRQDSEHRPEPVGHSSPLRIACSPAEAVANGLELVFLATPPEVSMELAPLFLDAGLKVIDLSGAFRFPIAADYEMWYRAEHKAPALLAEAVYGLPEFYRDAVARARLVSNPGCYPTAANLALRPLVEAGIVDRRAGVVCDAKSGVSGAGRKASLKTSFCEVGDNFSAYSLLDHRHAPEVLINSGLQEAEFSFTAHLIPIDRGILETIYLRTSASGDDLLAIYRKAYANEPFVQFYPPGKIPDLHSVQHTNFCGIGWKADARTGRAVVVSVIDNLVKGAAGQAVQNMNLVLGYPETEGLL